MVKYDVVVSPDISPDGEVMAPFPKEVLLDKMEASNWTDDPGTGKAILTPLGSEIVSPIPVAPPIGYENEPSVMDRLRDMLNQRLRQLAEGDVLDETEEEANDFDVPDPEDFHPRSIYEITLIDEAPALRPARVESAEGSDSAPVAPAGESNGDGGAPV